MLQYIVMYNETPSLGVIIKRQHLFSFMIMSEECELFNYPISDEQDRLYNQEIIKSVVLCPLSIQTL